MIRVSGLEAGKNQYRFWRFRGRPIDSVIYSPLEFRENIDHECKRIVRYRSRFSLAIFEVGRYENSTLIHRFVRTIHRRFRDTDEIGWHRQGQIGVMMPITPSVGAWQVAEQISSLFSSYTASLYNLLLSVGQLAEAPSPGEFFYPFEHFYLSGPAVYLAHFEIGRIQHSAGSRAGPCRPKRQCLFAHHLQDGQSTSRHFGSATDDTVIVQPTKGYR
jgi:hypothetical protein